MPFTAEKGKKNPQQNKQTTVLVKLGGKKILPDPRCGNQFNYYEQKRKTA